jgi:internalin A
MKGYNHMKKSLCLTLVSLIVMGLAACGAPAAGEAASSEAETASSASAVTPDPSEESTFELTEEPVVVFTDEVLEELVRNAMGKPEGDITLAEAEAVTELNLEMEGGVPIPRVADISDLTQFPNLTSLNLDWALYNGDEAIDISPLAGLTKLEFLYVCCDNISDISALSGMTGMKDLWIWGNNISDISALAGMTQIESLWIKGNQITDISALSGMTGLVYLYMEDNQVTDISPLSGMTKLQSLLVSGNPIEDYSPLADIYPNLTEKDFEIN